MTVQQRYTAYDRFAWFYQRHWGYFAKFACTMVEAFLLPRIPTGGRLLDLCCGTGQLAGMLAAQGFRVTGLDGSAEMLQFARENAPAAEFLEEDARIFSLPEQYHAAISTFDSLNHILALEELTAVFRNVCACLLPGGGFLFDLNIREGYLTHWRDSFGIVEEDHVCVGRSHYDDEARLARLELTLFRLEGEWMRDDLTLWQRCYDEEEITGALHKAGFSAVQIIDVERYRPGTPKVPRGRSFFLAWKEGGVTAPGRERP